MNKKPTEMTIEQIREAFLEGVRNHIDYWLNETKASTSKDKLEGLAFSLMSMLDGCDINIPRFIVVPNPHEDDKEYDRKKD